MINKQQPIYNLEVQLHKREFPLQKREFPPITSEKPRTVEASMSEFDIIYISYDEPNAEENWADLQSKVPWAKRVHGVKGFDEAHKIAACKSQTTNVITVDGDNKIDISFLNQNISYNPDWVYSGGGNNYINNLLSGNGGLKLWPKGVVLHMNTHENTDNEDGIEFCWKLPYYQMNDWYSISYNNTTPFQAFRVGFREGVKLSLHEGKKVSDLKSQAWIGNIKRLKIWMTVGADVKNGIYAIYGARLGCYLTNFTNFDISLIADYDWFDTQWHEEWLPIINDKEMFQNKYNWLLKEIRNGLDIEIVNLGQNQSRFFKSTIENPARMGLTVPERAGAKQHADNHFRDKEF